MSHRASDQRLGRALRAIALAIVANAAMTRALFAQRLSSWRMSEPVAISVADSAALNVPTAEWSLSSLVSRQPSPRISIASSHRNSIDDARLRAAPWWSPVASAFIPGAGQFAMGQQRSVAYAVAELYLVVQALTARRDYRRDRDEYRGIASDVARRPFGGSRPIGVWDYYELMEKYLESGVYSKSASGVVVPETDTATYNGASWLLARQNYWPNPDIAPATSSPEYQRALAEYNGRAIRDEFRWSWRDATLQQDLYRQTITQANQRAQRALNLAGLVGMNHLASMIDAYVTVRVRRFGGVRVAGASLDGIQSEVRSLGDPALGLKEIRTGLRFVPAR